MKILHSGIQVKAMLATNDEGQSLGARAAAVGNRELFEAVLTAMREKLDREQV